MWLTLVLNFSRIVSTAACGFETTKLVTLLALRRSLESAPSKNSSTPTNALMCWVAEEEEEGGGVGVNYDIV